MAPKKRINVYLQQESIDRADRTAGMLHFSTGKEVNRSNVIELALWFLHKQTDSKIEELMMEFTDQTAKGDDI